MRLRRPRRGGDRRSERRLRPWPVPLVHSYESQCAVSIAEVRVQLEGALCVRFRLSERVGGTHHPIRTKRHVHVRQRGMCSRERRIQSNRPMKMVAGPLEPS